MVKVLAINSSPHMRKGTTALLLNQFLKSMKEKGAEIETFYTSKLNINSCKGCLNCWFSAEEKCSQRDDMDTILPKIADADIFIIASPIYVDGLTGPMKNLIDRMLPLLDPYVELRNGHCRHPVRKYSKPGKVVLVSSCAWWKKDNFDPMIMHIKAMCANMGREFAGALVRPHAGAMMYLKATGGNVDDIFEAISEAGRNLIEKGEMSIDNLNTISRELVPLDTYIQIFNQNMKANVKSVREK
ncbi:MAG: flavodoxin family protein [Promethearchaeota archaeon]|jgi:multimeric flavodoxin WrbA